MTFVIERYDVGRLRFGRRRCAPMSVPRGRSAMAHCHRRDALYLRRYVRLGGWVLFGAPLALVGPWLVPLGVLAFEIVVYVIGRRQFQPEAPGDLPPPPYASGDREPRVPYPSAGSGAVALPLED